MVRFFLRIYDTINNRRWHPVSISLIVWAICLTLASRINYQEDISAFLPVDQETAEYTDVYTKLGGQDRIAVIFNGDTMQMIPAMDYFGETLIDTDTTGMVRNLQVTIDEEYMLDVMSYIWHTYPLLLSDKNFSHIDSLLFTNDFVRSQMEDNRRLLMLPFGSVVTQSLPWDPLHLSAPITSQLQKNEINDHYQVIDGHIFSKRDKQGIVLLSTPYGISESRQNERLVSLLNNVADTVKERYPGMEISNIGASVIAVGNASQIKSDSLLAVTLSVFLIFVVLFYSFRRWGDIGWIGISIVFGWTVALGCIALFYENISIIVLGISSVIIGIAVNYPLHFLDHLRHEPNRRNALKEMVPPLLIGNITTVSAFLCLVFIDADAMRDLGIFGSLVLIATIAFVLILLPSLVSQRKQSGKVHFILPNTDLKIPRLFHQLLLPLVVLLTIVFGYLSTHTSFDSDMQHINYMTPEQRENLKQLSSSMQASDSLITAFAVSKGDNLDKALIANEDLLKVLYQENRIHHITGIGDLVPSSEMVQKRTEKWNALWKKHAETILLMKEEAESQGFSSEVFKPFFDLCNADSLTINYDNPLQKTIGNNYILQNEKGQVHVVNVLQIEKNKIDEVKQTLRNEIEEQDLNAFVFDSTDVSSSLVTVLSDSFNYIGFVCGFVVFAFLWLFFGRLELSIISFLPLAVSWLWILGIMDIFSVQFNIINIILATFIFGQGDDYSIFITEGLTYEYAYGKPRLKSYKNSIMLSAVLMFIGIGTLLFAKHPALRSLAEVAIIGMVTVVCMTFYLPPLVFRWLTTKHGVIREVPLTVQRILYSLWALSFFLFFSILIFEPYALFHRFFLIRSKKCREFFHKVLQLTARFVIYRVPGVKLDYINAINETFEKPAVIICNHQSHLDVMCLLMMSPKIVILTNDWVWHNPFYGAIIRAAEFYSISDGWEKNLERLTDLVSRGYSVVVFPEGTREIGRNIMHFHKGAFYLAQQLKVDILPIMIHGLMDVLPKRDFMLRRGKITVEVHQRMTMEEIVQYDDRILRTRWFKWYCEQYQDMSRRIEDAAYYIPFVNYKYMYKGADVERRCKSVLKNIANNPTLINRYMVYDKKIIISNCGQGEIAWIAALTHPECEIFAYESDSELYAIAINVAGKPSNLYFINQPFTTQP
ncbi:1-acyl-sn-glycerol-3-phosphate acyltransferase [Parabacteroides sp.]